MLCSCKDSIDQGEPERALSAILTHCDCDSGVDIFANFGVHQQALVAHASPISRNVSAAQAALPSELLATTMAIHCARMSHFLFTHTRKELYERMKQST